MKLRVTLVPLAAGDATLIWRWAQNRDLNRLTGAWPEPPTLAAVEGLVRSWIIDDHTRAFIIDVEGNAVGNCWLGHIDATSATLGITLAEPDFRDRGFGTEAIRLLLAHASGLTVRLWAYADNERAVAIYRKLGFVVSRHGERDGRQTVEMEYHA